MDAMDDEESQGNIINLLRNGKNFIKMHNRIAFKKLPTKRENYPDYEERATTEILINAIIHRSYLEIGSEVHIDIFDDRLEISSPGGMTDGSLIQNRELNKVASKRRNPVIAEMFTRFDYMETRGSGFEKILESVKKVDDVEFYSTHSTFFVTLKNMNYDNELLNNEKTNDTVNDMVNDMVNDTVKSVFDEIVKNPKITKPELSAKLNKGVATISRAIKSLKEKNLIERIGSDKTGYWEVK